MNKSAIAIIVFYVGVLVYVAGFIATNFLTSLP